MFVWCLASGVLLAAITGCIEQRTVQKTPVELKTQAKSDFVEAWDEPLTLLLLGSDARSENPAGLSDSIIVIRFDPQSGRSVMVSIPRDSRVAIPGRGYGKLNAAMSYGGPKLTAKTIEDLLGIKIDHHTVITFFGFSRIVNSLGGVDVELSEAIKDPWAGADLPAGSRHLDGQQALAFARSRHIPDGDFARMGHQQDLLIGLWQGLSSQTLDLRRFFEIMTTIDGNSSCTIASPRLLLLARAVNNADPGSCSRLVIRGRIQNIDGTSFVIPDPGLIDEARRLLERL